MSCLGSINHKATFKHSMANVLIFSFSLFPVFHVLLAMITSTLHSFLLIVVFTGVLFKGLDLGPKPTLQIVNRGTADYFRA